MDPFQKKKFPFPSSFTRWNVEPLRCSMEPNRAHLLDPWQLVPSLPWHRNRVGRTGASAVPFSSPLAVKEIIKKELRPICQRFWSFEWGHQTRLVGPTQSVTFRLADSFLRVRSRGNRCVVFGRMNIYWRSQLLNEEVMLTVMYAIVSRVSCM